MYKFLITAIASALITALPAVESAQSRPGETSRSESGARSQKEQSSRQPGSGSASKNQYGEWQSAWGKTPPAPPAHWTKKGDWYRHVRACQQRYKSYKVRTDGYRTYSGKTARCKL